ncbi:hypothetical protein SLEP1_g1574 [Rubroshorea leprosula]|uniref:Uncharacterized protein n=1 Tax=Rubroshorea leprosula TaxID=152421 RepID=A0AAV5HK45_9ROSI|nr:hypothetical protein SLEP1_g1574 [Rubroshorea leprosula]
MVPRMAGRSTRGSRRGQVERRSKRHDKNLDGPALP